ncbi:MAG: hypothetical protein Q9225_007361, partial [Loekoesia sp. 1 TL-2023]
MTYSDAFWTSCRPSSDNALEDEWESRQLLTQRKGRASRPLLSFLLLCFIFLFCFVLGFIAGEHYDTRRLIGEDGTPNHAKTCKSPALRREWRSLSQEEKIEYIQAVKCLKTVPSLLQLNQTLYDDFPWVHKNFGEDSHDAAPFLAWHRYFIHVYEQKLQEHCGYQGHLTYWDWTLDWENITLSPVWDDKTGFGGTGNASTGTPIFKAYCVTEGPFAGLEVPYFEDIYKPHCLLRGFDGNLKDFRERIHPGALMDLLLSPDYSSLNLGLEHGPHVAIPQSVNGDFSLHTAPFDPVFFLHHTQLDRMWWRWQHAMPEKRTEEYAGKASTDSNKKATLADMLYMGGLAPDIRVSDIMNT